MRLLARVALPFAFAGCPGSNDAPPTPPDPPGKDVFVARGTVVADTNGAPLAGAAICVYDDADEELAPCQATDDAGGYSFDALPLGVRIELNTQSEGFASVSNAIYAAAPGQRHIDVRMIDIDDFSALNTVSDPENVTPLGMVAWTFLDADAAGDTGIAGGSVTRPIPVEGTEPSGTILYPEPDGTPNPDATGTSTSGLSLVVGLPPDAYEFEVNGPPGYECDSAPFLSVGERRVRVNVRSGTVSAGFTRCTKQE